VQTVSLLNPLRHFVRTSRRSSSKGGLALFAVVTLALAIRQYSKRTA